MQPSSSFFFSHLNWNLIGFICPSSRAVEVWKRFTQIQKFDFLFQIIISKGLKEFECDLFYPRLFLRQGWKTAFDFQLKGRRVGPVCTKCPLFRLFHLITFLVSVWSLSHVYCSPQITTSSCSTFYFFSRKSKKNIPEFKSNIKFWYWQRSGSSDKESRKLTTSCDSQASNDSPLKTEENIRVVI